MVAMKSAILPVLLLLCLFSSLVICDDCCCFQGNDGSDCATLLCGLFSKNSDSADSADVHSPHVCVSVWNTPVIAPSSGLCSPALAPVALISSESGQLIVQPVRLVYHPPTA